MGERLRLRTSLAAGLLGMAAVGACRDAPEMHEPSELPPLGPAPYQLTFDPGREIAPAWSASGDSVLYVTERLTPPGPDTGEDSVRTGKPLQVIHREGGVSQRLFPVLQSTTDATTPIDYATQSVDGRIASFTLLPPLPASLCGGEVVSCMPEFSIDTPPRLDAAILRVRPPGEGGAPDADPQLVVEMPGREFDTTENPAGLDGLWRTDTYPFQRQFNVDRRAPSKVSWQPGEGRVVFSDGVGLRIWHPATGEVTRIPGTEDGVNPSLSPTGTWIAFERYERGPRTEVTCHHELAGNVVCMEQRQSWPLLGRSVALIRPDGSDLRLLTAGARPVWGSDEERIYYEFGGHIWRIGVDGVGAAPVDGTESGFWPAVSPDGRWLAFARIDSLTATSDIWIVDVGN